MGAVGAGGIPGTRTQAHHARTFAEPPANAISVLPLTGSLGTSGAPGSHTRPYQAPIFVEPPPNPKRSSNWLVVIGLVGAGFVTLIMSCTILLASSVNDKGADPDALLRAQLREFQELNQQSPNGTHDDLINSPRDRNQEDSGTVDATLSDDVDSFVDPTIIEYGALSWTRDPVKDPRTGKTGKYASIKLAEAACSSRSGTWRLPSVFEYRELTKDGRIANDYLLQVFPTGAFWATPDTRIQISASGVLDTYNGSAPPMALCVKEFQ